MPQLLEVVRAVLEEYAGKTLPSKQELRSILDKINSLSDEELDKVYRTIGGGAAATKIGVQHIDRLPYPVAILLYMTNDQRNDLVRLLFLFETVECYVRWRVVQALSVLHTERNFVIPDSILTEYSSKVTRPSMGIWVGMLEHIGKQIQKNETVWGVDATQFGREIKLLNGITKKRNEIAHGNVMGDVTYAAEGEQSTLDKTIAKAEELFEKYSRLSIEHFIRRPDQSYTANGAYIRNGARIKLSAQGDNRLDQRESYYAFTAEGQPMLQVPCTFLILPKPPDIPVPHLTHQFSTATFISTQPDCTAVDGGGTLVYSIVDRQDKETQTELSDFIRLFKTNVVTPSSEPWNGLFDEIIDSGAWKKDHKLLKLCRSKNAALTVEQGQLWYFGGNAQTGRSTLLLSYLNNLRHGESYVFPFRFTKTDNQIDHFLMSFREAIVYWLRKKTEVPAPDTTLTGDDLRHDVNTLLESLMFFLKQNSSIKGKKKQLIIGLDNLEHIYDLHVEEQPRLNRLLEMIDSWKKYTYTQKRKVGSVEQRQIFVLGTAMNQNASVQDMDNYCDADTRVSFVYASAHLEQFASRDNVAEHSSSREREMHQQQSNPLGAHMPPIGKYGAIQIMTERSRNGGFGAKDHKFITGALRVANNNPVIIDALAENLNDGVISIDDPVTHDSYGVLSKSGSPYLQNHALLIPMILCFMHELQVLLTVSSLQVLCSARNYPVSAEDKYISDVLYDIPQYVEKIALSEANSDGSLAFGWGLRKPLTAKHLPNLSFVLSICRLRIRQLINDASHLPDSLQLKSIFIHRGSINAPAVSSNLVAALFHDLRGTLTKDIQAVLTKHSAVQEFQRSAHMFHQTAAIGPTNITWLQKASESHSYHEKAKEYTESPAFEEFWLKQKNTEPVPLFAHELQVVGYPEKLLKTLSVNDNYYVAIGAGYNSIAMYHHKRSQPDVVFLSFTALEKATSCVVVSVQNENCYIAISVGTMVYLHTVQITDRARIIEIKEYNYNAPIKGLLLLDSEHLAVYGDRIDSTEDGDKWAVDMVYDVSSDTPSWSTVYVDRPTTSTHKPRFGFDVHSTSWITYGKTVINIRSTQASPRYSLGFTPPADKPPPKVLKNGFLYQTGTNRTTTKSSWFHTINNSAQALTDSNGAVEFFRIVYAEVFEEDRLLTIDYRSTIRIYEWGQQAPVCEVKCHAFGAENVYSGDITGALRDDTRLLIYGKRGFMAFYDIACLSGTISTLKSIQPYHSTDCHYGGISGAKHLVQSLNGVSDLFITWSEDNDLRLWSWTSGESDKPKCLGLFRGHEDKVKDIQVSGDTIVSIDNKNNIRTWQINQGCVDQIENQRALNDPLCSSTPEISLEQCPGFINSAMLIDDTLWSVTSVEGKISFEEHQQRGTNWSQRQALYQQQSPQLLQDSSLQKSIHMGSYIFLLLQDERVLVWDVINKKELKNAALQDLSVSNWQLNSAGLLLWSKEAIYLLDTQQRLTTLAQAKELEKITAARLDSSGLSYATRQHETFIAKTGKNKGKESTKGTKICHIYKANVDGSNSRVVDSCVLEGRGVDVHGIYHNNNLLLYWFVRENKPLEMYWYDDSIKHTGNFPHSLPVPTHRLLTRAPHTIYRLPKEEGLSFKSGLGDNDRRWVLKFDFPLIKEDTTPPIPKELQLNLYSNWEYASEHLSQMLIAFGSKTSTLNHIYAQASSFGVVVHYQTAKRNGRLLWTGTSIRDFHVIAVTLDGLVLLRKNRNIIALQLMKGNQEATFEELKGQDSVS